MLAAIGTTTAAFEPDGSTSRSTASRSAAAARPATTARQVDLTGRDIHIRVDLHAGEHAATIWTNDLSHAYVEENSAYST